MVFQHLVHSRRQVEGAPSALEVIPATCVIASFPTTCWKQARLPDAQVQVCSRHRGRD
jgi:hypothetical protein